MPAETITTVVTAADTYDLVSLDDVRAELKLPDSDTSQDDFLQRIISQVSSSVQSYCNRNLVAETVQDIIFPGRDPYPYQVPGGVAKLLLSRYPIVSLTSVIITNSPGSTTTLTENTDFITDAGNGQLLRLDPNTGYPVTWQPVQVTAIYQAGYNPIPGDVQDAVLRLVTGRFYMRGRDPTLKSQDQPGLGSRTYWVGSVPGVRGPYPDDIMGVFDQYRVPVVR